MAWTLRKRRDTGWLDITSRATGHLSGSVYIRRIEESVWLRFVDLVLADGTNSYATVNGLIPQGFRFTELGFTTFALPATNSAVYSPGPLRTDRNGNAVVYDTQGERRIRGAVSWPCDDPMPTGGA